jgi:hypothetical protein
MDPSSPNPVAFACAVKRAFPAIPSSEALAVAVHVVRAGRGRVSSTAKGQTLARQAIRRAVINHVRHSHTGYDALLRTHGDRMRARAEVRDVVAAVVHAWSDIRASGHAVCARCWQTKPRHLRSLERDAELAAESARVAAIDTAIDAA